MNVTEMHIAVQQGVDKINSLQADSLLPEEIDIELNKSMYRFINTKYNKNNIYQKGFEESQKRIDDLRTLVREYEDKVTFKEQLKSKIFVDTFRLPSDYMYLVNQASRIYLNNCRPIKYTLEHPSPILYFAVDFNNFVLNNENKANSFVTKIKMIGNNSGSTIVWQPSTELKISGYTETSYPANIEDVRQDILNNPEPGFTIYWEDFKELSKPGHFIIIVDTNVHNWALWDSSIGIVSTLVADVLAHEIAPTPVSAQAVALNLVERRVPIKYKTTVLEGNRFSQQDDIFKLLSDPFNTTKHTSPLTTIRGRSIDIYTNDIFIVDSVKITYIRTPQQISLSLGIDCELPEHTHQEIVSMTVSSILETISDPRYQSSIIEGTKNE